MFKGYYRVVVRISGGGRCQRGGSVDVGKNVLQAEELEANFFGWVSYDNWVDEGRFGSIKTLKKGREHLG